MLKIKIKQMVLILGGFFAAGGEDPFFQTELIFI